MTFCVSVSMASRYTQGAYPGGRGPLGKMKRGQAHHINSLHLPGMGAVAFGDGMDGLEPPSVASAFLDCPDQPLRGMCYLPTSSAIFLHHLHSSYIICNS